MNKNKINTFTTILLACLLPLTGATQVLDFSFEFQAYPTGLIPGLRIEKPFHEKNAVHLRLGYNWIRHGSLGVQDDERGDGFGFSLGYKRYLKSSFRSWYLGLKNDIWFNELDWETEVQNATMRGTSKIIVVQPTLEAGHLFLLKNNWIFTPSIAFGFEINVKTEGAEMGQGAILLLGFHFGRRF
ncbi:MAG: DUF3575 domain-containing protein [Bacteroidota bacterium]